jgi:AraC-like DNA-binding protein
MDREPGLSLVILRPLARGLGSVGVDPDEFLRLLGVERADGLDAFVPGSHVGKALGQIARTTGPRTLGLTLARQTPMGSFGTFDHAVWTGGSLRDAIARSSHFYSLVTEGVSLHLEERAGQAHVSMRAPRAARHGTVITDIALGLNVLRAREATGHRLRLRAVTFRHRADDARPYEEFFQAGVSFSQPVDGVVFDRGLLDLPVRTPDSAAATEVDARAARLQARLQSEDPFLNTMRAALLRGLWAKDAGLARMARELGIGARTLQRQLSAHGTTHRAIADDLRRELATWLLTRQQTPIIEVAYEVGFASLPVFYRAFSRWTGTTPASFRAARRSRDA